VNHNLVMGLKSATWLSRIEADPDAKHQINDGCTVDAAEAKQQAAALQGSWRTRALRAG
jgi:hypothetical protein